MSNVPQQGSENRSSILPNMVPQGLGFFGSPYSPADAMLTPSEIGVQVGDSMSDVANAVKGVAFYADSIGFGAPSSALTQGMPLKPLGVNYFIKTGKTCSNGAEMWSYFKGISEGDALGERVKNTMEQMGLPPLKGLAPGMIEDAENALNPEPLLNTLFGSGYPQCKLATLAVGDAYGRISDPETGVDWIGNPELAQKTDFGYTQTRWIQDTDSNNNPINLTRDQWAATPKTYNKDGTSTATQSEGFAPFMYNTATISVIGILCLIAFGIVKK